MSEPKIAGAKPVVLDLKPGTYWWCACGRSQNQPFCDGSHQGNDFAPVQFKVDIAGRSALCMCKRTGDQPRCDGSHSKL
ncbi:MAG: CDGSH iron-sulfur domain-containing protein [bacterium]|nr:CDGSH iron-sulfur domain-containing protein [bacterium]